MLYSVTGINVITPRRRTSGRQDGCRADHRADRPPPRRRAPAISRSAATPAARCAFRRHSAAFTGSGRPTAGSILRARSTWRRPSTSPMVRGNARPSNTYSSKRRHTTSMHLALCVTACFNKWGESVADAHQATVRAKKAVACLLFVSGTTDERGRSGPYSIRRRLRCAAGPARSVAARTCDRWAQRRGFRIWHPELDLGERVRRLAIRLTLGVPASAVHSARKGAPIFLGGLSPPRARRAREPDAYAAAEDDALLACAHGDRGEAPVRSASHGGRRRNRRQQRPRHGRCSNLTKGEEWSCAIATWRASRRGGLPRSPRTDPSPRPLSISRMKWSLSCVKVEASCKYYNGSTKRLISDKNCCCFARQSSITKFRC